VVLKPIIKHHIEWLSLIEVSGPFLVPSVLNSAFPNGLFPVERRLQENLFIAYNRWKEEINLNKGDLRFHKVWVEYVLAELLGYREFLLDFMKIPQNLSARSVTGKNLKPDYVLFNESASLLIRVLEPNKNLEKSSVHTEDKPLDEMRELLRATNVPLGLVTNGRIWTLVYSKREEPTGYATWDSEFWQEEKISLSSFQNLLELRRFYGLSEEETLLALYEKSKNEQIEITRQLGDQVQRAVEIFIQNMDRINRDRDGKLLEGIPLIELYNSALTFMMRIIFLFYAEENGLLFGNPKIGDKASSYGLLNLRQELREIADQKGEEVLERRQDAYIRILATCRAIYEGIHHQDLSLPAYGGSLFDPNRYPFLEGRTSSKQSLSEALPLPIHNRTILHILEAIQTLRIKLAPGEVESRRISFRSLDVKQIGHVYEGLLDHTAKTAKDTLLKLKTKKDAEAILELSEIEKEFKKGINSFVKYLEERKVKNLNQFKKNLTLEKKDQDLTLLRSVCEGKENLVKRIAPYLDLLEEDTFDQPLVVVGNGVYVAPGNERRATGTHYTPEETSIPLVVHTLEPLIYNGVMEGKTQSEWKIKTPEEILTLKICDSAMGSGAILVQVLRYMADRLLEALDTYPESAPRILPFGKESEGNQKEEFFSEDKEKRKLQAKRLIADRCIYGVDINPMAVEMAKLSIWLETLDEGKPFSFLDHAFKCGDSLLGVTNTQLEEYLGDQILMDGYLKHALRDSISLREELENTPDDTIEFINKKRITLEKANEALNVPRATATLITAALYKGITREQYATQSGEPEKLLKVLQGKNPFLWHLEFPEVFQEGGFDAFVGNPPFMGGQKITGNMGEAYREYLVNHLANQKRGSADLVAYFFLRNFSLLKEGGNFGLISTNTIAQGDTREAGLDQITSPPNPLSEAERGSNAKSIGIIYRAIPSQKWPNAAAVYVANVWIHKGQDWKASVTLVDEQGKETNVSSISPYLSQKSRVEGKPFQLKANEGKSFQGSIVLGMGFVMEPEEAEALIQKNPKNKNCLYPYLNGEDLNSRPDQSPSRWVIQFFDWPLNRSASGKWGETPLEHAYKNLDILVHSTITEDSNEAMVVDLWKVDSHEAVQLKNKTGLELLEYTHSIENYTIKHILKKHGNANSEESRGQEAITQEEIFQIPEILYRPDTIEYAGKNKKNLETIRYTKDINGVLYYFEEVRTGKKELMGTTLYKKKPERENAGKSPLPLTPEASLRQEFNGTMRQRISQAIYGENVTPSSGFTFYKDPPDIDKPLSIERRDWLRVGIVPSDYPYPVAADYPDLLQIVVEKVKPERDKNTFSKSAKQFWWRYERSRPELYSTMFGVKKVLVGTLHTKFSITSYFNKETIFTHALYCVVDDSFEMFSITNSNFHEYWAWEYSSTMGENTLRYSPSDCFETFPFPDLDSPSLRDIGQQYYELRKQIMVANNEGMTKTYNRFHDPKYANDKNTTDVKTRLIASLRELHVAMDYAVRDAYGWTDLDLEHGFHETKQGVRFTVSDRARVEILDRLLELNHARHAVEVAEEEERKRLNVKSKSNSKKKASAQAETIHYPKDLFGDQITSDLFGKEIESGKGRKRK